MANEQIQRYDWNTGRKSLNGEHVMYSDHLAATNDLREGQMHLAMELEQKDEQIRKLRDALWGIGAMPNGFCCCPAFRDPDKESHCGECTMARAALKAGE